MEVEKNLEEKKKFEKPQMGVVKLKPAGMVCGSCPTDICNLDGICGFND